MVEIDFFYFDVGGTLIDPHPSVGAVYQRVGERFGIRAPPGRLDAVFAEVWSEHVGRSGDAPLAMGTDVPSTHAWWRALVFQVLDRLDFEGDAEACYRAFFEAFEDPQSWKVYDDVRPTLEALAEASIPTGIISNWDYRLVPLLERLGLAEAFSHTVVSCFEGIAKPDLELFRRAIDRTGLEPGRIRYVGDHRRLDLDPALAVGMDAYVIDREGKRGAAPRIVRRLDALIPS